MPKYTFSFLLLISVHAFATIPPISDDEKDIGSRCKIFSSESRCIVNTDTGSRFGFSVTPIYKNYYDMLIIPAIVTVEPKNEASCEDGKTNKPIPLPANSNFRQTLHYDSQTKEQMVVHVTKVPLPEGADEEDAEALRSKWFSKPWIVCNTGTSAVNPNHYKRVGGVDTGILVIPFKLRQGDIFSDSTVGPYFSYKFERLELIATTGLAQISVAEMGSDEIESKSGLTAGLGISFELAQKWDVAFIAGVDHLSGSAGDEWKYQDKPWLSFAIGYNFTRRE